METLQLSENIQISRNTLIGAVATLAFVLMFGGVEFYVSHVSDDVDALRTALSSVQDARGKLKQKQVRKDAVARRYATKAPALAGFIEQTARKESLEVSDSSDHPEVPAGAKKKYVERESTVHFKKSGMYAIGKFLETIEKSSYPIEISRLNIRKRSGEPDSYDVEVGASAFDQATEAPKKEKP